MTKFQRLCNVNLLGQEEGDLSTQHLLIISLFRVPRFSSREYSSLTLSWCALAGGESTFCSRDGHGTQTRSIRTGISVVLVIDSGMVHDSS